MAFSKAPHPLDVSVHDLVGHPGEEKKFNFEVPAEPGVAVRLVTVPVGSTIKLDGRFESVHEGILVTGTVAANATAECSRCLDPIESALGVDFQELFAYDSDEEFDFFVKDEMIDLNDVVKDAIVLAMPFQPVCREDCPGLCPECGAKSADDPSHQHEAVADPRWAALSALDFEPESVDGDTD